MKREEQEMFVSDGEAFQFSGDMNEMEFRDVEACLGASIFTVKFVEMLDGGVWWYGGEKA